MIVKEDPLMINSTRVSGKANVEIIHNPFEYNMTLNGTAFIQYLWQDKQGYLECLSQKDINDIARIVDQYDEKSKAKDSSNDHAKKQ